ncbi:hypothetical protein KCTC52924_00328 [Arenibacter antarcticus]
MDSFRVLRGISKKLINTFCHRSETTTIRHINLVDINLGALLADKEMRIFSKEIL